MSEYLTLYINSIHLRIFRVERVNKFTNVLGVRVQRLIGF
jgi:hypothetical protein